MQRELLPLPIDCENLVSGFDKKSLLRIVVTVLALLCSFYGFAELIKWRISTQSIDENQQFLGFILFAGICISLIFSFVISVSSWTLIKLFPGDPIYKISLESIEIIYRNAGPRKVLKNSGISTLEKDVDGYYRVSQNGEDFLLPRLVNPIGSGIKIFVIPFSKHSGSTFFRTHEICLAEGKIRVARVWKKELASSRYPS
jgi:hypothetical protein